MALPILDRYQPAKKDSLFSLQKVNKAELRSVLERLGPHDHLCSIFETPQELLAMTVPYFRIGLERNEKCIYITDKAKADTLCKAMRREGIDIGRAIDSKALVLIDTDQAYLKGDGLNPERMLPFWKREEALAKKQGYRALRGAAEVDWPIDGEGDKRRWLKYESKVNNVFSTLDSLVLCQYNQHRYPPELIL